MSLYTVASIRERDQFRWDTTLEGNAFYSSFQWLLSREATRTDTYGYVVPSDGNAGVPFCVDRAGHFLYLGATVGNHNALPASTPHLTGTLEWAKSYAEDRQLRVRFQHCNDSVARRIQNLAPVTLEEAKPDAMIYCPEQTFSGYVRANAPLSKNWRTERNRFNKSGAVIEVGRISDFDGTVIDSLLLHTGQKYGNTLDSLELAHLREAQSVTLNDRSIVFMCYREGEPLGCSIGFVWDGCLYQRVGGFDYERLANAFEYFNTVYYTPLDLAGKFGYTRIHLGTGSIDAKARRGAQVFPQWHVTLR